MTSMNQSHLIFFSHFLMNIFKRGIAVHVLTLLAEEKFSTQVLTLEPFYQVCQKEN